MANFKGFKQVSLATYNGLSDDEKKNYLWLVRDLSGATVVSSAIYFGTRKYAEVNNDAASEAKVDAIVSSLGNVIDEEGNWLGFLPFDEHEILGNEEVGSFTDALSALEAAILAKADAADVQAKLDELEEKIDAASSAIESGITQDIEEVKSDVEKLNSDLAETNAAVETKADKAEVNELSEKVDALDSIASAITEELGTKANAEDVYTKDEVDAKIVGLFHFVGTADGISADETTIFYDGQNIEAGEENVGEVYQIGDKEYASNGQKWVKLGFNIDLSEFATKEEVDEKLSGITSELDTTQEALAKEIEERQALTKNATTTAQTFEDAEEMDLQLGQIVYIINETSNSGITYGSGAYIKTQDGLKKLDSTTPSTSTTLDERVESLENRTGANQTAIEELNSLLGNEPFEGESVTEAIAALQADSHTLIEGDDVEE